MKSLSLGIVRASVSSALAYSRLCSGKPDPAPSLRGAGERPILHSTFSILSHASEAGGTP
ncbi:MAG: hypothetical protein LBQ31_07555 [Bacteroidales bacterium]|nr:hypothetical protein [Bacteroidales bacterium]